MPKRPIVTLLSDFGLAEPYVAEMKGVILSIAPGAAIVDLTHEIAPGDVLAGALALRQALPSFPEGTVHCAVVDPGVGTDRRILAARYAGQTVVLPDNGLITMVDRDLPLEAIAAVRDQRYFRHGPISTSFHGRDIMAPVAAHLAGGLPPANLGPRPETFKLLELAVPQALADGAVAGQVIHVDRFGNLVTNIPAGMLAGGGREMAAVCVSCGGRPVGPIVPAFGFVPAGAALALINSMDLLEVAVNGARACDVLGAGVGAEVLASPSRPAGPSVP